MRPTVIAGGHGDDERDFVRPFATTLAALILVALAAEHGIVHLDAPIEFPRRLVLQHHLAKLLAHEPSAIPLEVELTG